MSGEKMLADKSWERSDKIGNLSWYTPLNYLKELDGVVEVKHDDTSNSSGDWSGHIIQKYYGSYYLMFFSQENHEYSFGVYIGKGQKLSSKNANDAIKEVDAILKDMYHA